MSDLFSKAMREMLLIGRYKTCMDITDISDNITNAVVGICDKDITKAMWRVPESTPAMRFTELLEQLESS